MAVRQPDIYGRALQGRSADDGATDDPASRRPHLRVRSTPTGRNGPLLRAPLAGTPPRAHQRLPGPPGAPRRSAPQAGPTPSTRRSGKRTSRPSWTTGRSSTRSCRSRRLTLVRQAAPAPPPQLPPVPAATGGGPQRRRAGGAPVTSHGPDDSIPSMAARPLTRQATSGSWERWATSLCHEHRRSRGHRTRAPDAASHCRAASPPGRKVGWRASVDDQGLIATGVDRSVWLDARGEDGPGPLVGPVQRAWVHGPVRRPVEPFRPVLPVADAGLGQRAARPPAARAGVGAVAVIALVVHVPAVPHGVAGAPAELALRSMCTRPPLVAPHISPSLRRRTFPLPVAPTRANVDGRRPPVAAGKEGPRP